MSDLQKELLELFDLRNGIKHRKENMLDQEVAETKKDIKRLTIMFSDGIPNLAVPLNEKETLLWDCQAKKVLYSNLNTVHFIDSVEKKTIIKVRPYLRNLVALAREQVDE